MLVKYIHLIFYNNFEMNKAKMLKTNLVSKTMQQFAITHKYN